MSARPNARRRWSALLAGLCLSQGCGAPPVAPPLPLTVEVAGCRALAVGPRCLPSAGVPLVLWVESAAQAEIEVRSGGGVVAPEYQDGRGRRYRLPVVAGGEPIEVVARRDRTAAVWRLALARDEQPGWLTAATADYRAGRLESARSALEANPGAADPRWRGAAQGLLGRIDLAAGDRASAERRLLAAAADHRAAGELLDEVRDGTVVAYLRLDAGDYAAARGVLDALPADGGPAAEAAYYLAYYRGLLAEETGDLGSALAHTLEAAARAGRVGLARERLIAEQIHARELQLVGRAAEAASLFARLRREAAASLDGCDRAQLLNNSAWALLLAREAGEVTAEDPVPLLEEALASFAQGCPGSPYEVRNARLNLGLAHLQAGEAGAARRLLVADEGAEEEPRLALWRMDLEGRVALAEGRSRGALDSYRRLAERAAVLGSPDAAWRARLGEARAWQALGQEDRALAAYAAADELVDEQSLRVPWLAGRETFLAQREGGTRGLLELLLAGHRDTEALAVARRSRSRALAALERSERLARLGATARAGWDEALARYRRSRESLEQLAATAWQVPADRRAGTEQRRAELDATQRQALEQALEMLEPAGPRSAPLPPRPGELLLAYHPLEHDWAAFAWLDGAVAIHRFAAPPPAGDGAAAARLLLEPFAGWIERAESLRILPFGPLQEVDFQGLPWAGDVLAARRPVVYGLDLGRRVEAEATPATPVLLVADVAGDLPSARAEARAVEATLAGRGLEVRPLLGAAASGAAVRSALPAAGLFHFAGHAVFAGWGGWSSALPLAGGARLDVGDILALEAAPEVVVLAGCETGRAGGGGAAQGMGLAHAFLAAGSSAVVAAVRPVADADAALLVDLLYAAWPGRGSLAAALADAQIELRRRRPGSDWASFRLLEP